LNILSNVLDALTGRKNVQLHDILVLDSWEIEVKENDPFAEFYPSQTLLREIGEAIGKLCKIDSTWNTSTIEK